MESCEPFDKDKQHANVLIKLTARYDRSMTEISKVIDAPPRRAFTTGEHSDMFIKCGNKEWRAHSIILCGQSAFFDRALNGPWTVSSCPCSLRIQTGANGKQESSTRTIDFPEDDPADVEAMLRFMYTGTYFEGQRDFLSESSAEKAGLDDVGWLELRMYALGRQYCIEGLRLLALNRFEALMTSRWVNDYILDFVPVIYESTLDTDLSLRRALVSAISADAHDFTRNLDRRGNEKESVIFSQFESAIWAQRTANHVVAVKAGIEGEVVNGSWWAKKAAALAASRRRLQQ
ncbi:hypothetical protein MRB53_039399 [Persea americana]|nr:hypothetical protein MRB53_039399 [Persea americana]